MNKRTVCAVIFMVLFTVIFYHIQAGVIILNGLTHIHNVEKGTVLKGEIIMHNTSKAKKELVTIYLSDLDQDCSGNTYYMDVGKHIKSLGKWITFTTSEKVLEPDEKFTLVYTIKIPENINSIDGNDDGSFWGAMMVETSEPISEDYEYGMKISSKIRYGVQLIANVGELIHPEIEFVDVVFDKKGDDNYIVDIKIENKGIYMVQPTLILELFDDLGRSIKKEEAVFKKVYPDSCKDFKILFSGLSPGEYDGVLVADYGGDIYGINLSINIEED
jgi:hypothetical protein